MKKNVKNYRTLTWKGACRYYVRRTCGRCACSPILCVSIFPRASTPEECVKFAKMVRERRYSILEVPTYVLYYATYRGEVSMECHDHKVLSYI